MRSKMLPTVRRLAAGAAATLLVLGAAVPVVAYNEENVASIAMTRLDPISCTDDIRIRVELLDANDDPVPAADVNFSFGLRKTGDSLSPTSRRTNSNGRATVFVDLSCRPGLRRIRVRVPGDGGGHIYINCRRSDGCTRGTSGAVAGIEATNPTTAIVLPETDPVTDTARFTPPPPVAPPVILYLLGLLMATGIVVGLVHQRQPRRRGVERLAPD